MGSSVSPHTPQMPAELGDEIMNDAQQFRGRSDQQMPLHIAESVTKFVFEMTNLWARPNEKLAVALAVPISLKTLLEMTNLSSKPNEKLHPGENPENMGSYGAVYKARDIKTSELVAIKVISLSEGEEDHEEIRGEIEMLQQCSHPNVVRYLGSFQGGEFLWVLKVVMEYCGGGSVADLMSVADLVSVTAEPLEEYQIAYICREALKGLYSTKVHRDIKGGNILLSEQGEVKLGDFGVAAQLTRTVSKCDTFIETPHWAVPEVIQESRYAGKVDVRPLGVSSIEMTEGFPPRAKVHPMRELLFMISIEPAPMLEDKDECMCSSVPPQSPQTSANGGDPPIMKCAQEGDVDGLHQVIEKHKDQFQQFRVSNNRKTPLHIAAARGKTEFVLESMNLLPWLNGKLDKDGRTALHVAILEGHERTAMEILKENPVLMRRRDKEGRNALHLAVAHANMMPKLLKTLLEMDPGLIAQVNYEKQTALHIALENEKYDTFSSLLSGMKDRAQLQHLLEKKDSEGNTVLHIAAVKATPEATMKKLLTIMKNLDVINNQQKTALDRAVDPNMISLLKRAGAQGGQQAERVSWNSSKTCADKILSFLLCGPKISPPVSFLVLLIAAAVVVCQNPPGAILKNAAPPIPPTPIPAPGPYSRKELRVGHIHGNMRLPDAIVVVILLVLFILMAIISILSLIWRSGGFSLAASLFAVIVYSETLGNPAWLIPFSIALSGTLCVLGAFKAGVHLYEEHFGYLWWRRRAMNWILNMLPPLKRAIHLSQEEERLRNL